MKKSSLSVVVIAKNEGEFIKDCLESVKWADEIVLLDGGSIDQTVAIARQYGARIVLQKTKAMDFAAWHNQGKEEVKNKWLLYLDADERLTLELQKEIQGIVKQRAVVSAYRIKRQNWLLGRPLEHGGWGPDYQVRLFRRDKLRVWAGQLHERPEFEGELGRLKGIMIHLQPDKLEPALAKSIRWSKMEAELLFKVRHPPVVWWRVLRMGLTTWWERMVVKQGWRDGVEGWIENTYQAYHTMIVYLRLWELQRG